MHLDDNGNLIAAHAPFQVGPPLREVIADIAKNPAVRPKSTHFILAVNVKGYGMLRQLEETLAHAGNLGVVSLVFDIPGPELEDYIYSDLQVFGRLSEYENQVTGHCSGILLDCFSPEASKRHDLIMAANKRYPNMPICLIGESLRGREEWNREALEVCGVDYLIAKRIN